MLSPLQKRTIQAIVNVFETGRPAGDYTNVTVAEDDPGHLSYGRSQATLLSGNLAQLIRDYCAQPDALLASQLSPYLPRVEARDTNLDFDSGLHALLCRAGADPAMRRAQDALFDRAYWDPALHAAQALGIESPLGTGVIYDSFIHGAWNRLRDRTTALLGFVPALRLASARRGGPAPHSPPRRGEGGTPEKDEQKWVQQYIALRRDWLATHPNPLLRRAVYRMDTFSALAAAGNWDLALPLEAHGVRIRAENLEVPAAEGHGAPAARSP